MPNFLLLFMFLLTFKFARERRIWVDICLSLGEPSVVGLRLWLPSRADLGLPCRLVALVLRWGGVWGFGIAE